MSRETGKKKTKSPPGWLRALGKNGLPASFEIQGNAYVLSKTFKHDFFAATGLYVGESGKVILKMGRQASMFGFPLRWIGRFLMNHEAAMFERTKTVEGVPRFLGTYGGTGIVHDFVEGGPLKKEHRLDDEFFPRLDRMLTEIHGLGMAYVDLEKRENILLGEDGRPYLIDFQISWAPWDNWYGRTWGPRKLLSILQQADRYHLLKHWRRARPDQLTDERIAESHKAPFWIAWHRAIFRPVTKVRRQILVWLGARSSAAGRSPG